MQLQTYKIRSLYNNQWSDSAHIEAQYYADGSVRTTQDFYDTRFTRSFFFDHVGTLRQSYSGTYNQTFQHDAFGNTTDRQSIIWSEFDSFVATWINGRNQNPAWQYDANGTVRFDSYFEYTYDAKGVNSKVRNLNDNLWVSQTVNPEGLMTKRSTGDPTATFSTTYYLRSTMLGGKVVAEYNSAAQQQKRYAYLNGQLLASDDANNFNLEHSNPLTGSRGQSTSYGSIGGGYNPTAEPDSSGVVDVGFSDPNDVPPLPQEEPDIASILGGLSGECRIQGIQSTFGCYLAQRMLAGQTALRCPNDDCDAHLITVSQTIGGKLAATSRFFVTAGEPGWDGSLDGTYGWFPPLSKKIDLNDPNQTKRVVSRIPELFTKEYLTVIGSQRRQNSSAVMAPIGGLDRMQMWLEEAVKYKDCREALSKLLSQIGSDKHFVPSHTDILDLFHYLKNQTGGGGIFVDVTAEQMPSRIPGRDLGQRLAGGGGDSNLFYTDPSNWRTRQRWSAVYLKGVYPDRPNSKRLPYDYLVTLIHEITHNAPNDSSGMGITYDHPEMDGAARTLGSTSFDQYVKDHCIPKKYW